MTNTEESVLKQAEVPKNRAIVCTILGDAGVGKTSLCATFPSPVVIRVEDGVHGVPQEFRPSALPVIKSSEQLFKQMAALIKEKHDYKTVIVDSVTQLEELFISEVVEQDLEIQKRTTGHGKERPIHLCLGGWGAGRRTVADMHQKVRRGAEALIRNGINVAFIAHSEIDRLDPPDAESYTRYSLRMHKDSISAYKDNVDLVGFLKIRTFLKGNEDERQIAGTDGSRVLVCHAVPSSISKNRYGITEELLVQVGVNPLKEYVPAFNISKPKKGN